MMVRSKPAITLDLPVLHWLFERAVPLKGERVARASWNAYFKNNPKTLNHPQLRHLVKFQAFGQSDG